MTRCSWRPPPSTWPCATRAKRPGQALATPWGPSQVLFETPKVVMSILASSEAQPEQEPDVEVQEQRQRWEVTKTMAEALRRSDEGHFEEARALIRHRRKTLVGSGSAITEACRIIGPLLIASFHKAFAAL